MPLLQFLENAGKGLVQGVVNPVDKFLNEFGALGEVATGNQQGAQNILQPGGGLGHQGGVLQGRELGPGAVFLGPNAGQNIKATVGEGIQLGTLAAAPETRSMSFLKGGAINFGLGAGATAGSQMLNNQPFNLNQVLEGGAATAAFGGGIKVLSDIKATKIAKLDDPKKISNELEPVTGPVVANDVAPALAKTNDPHIVQNIVSNDIKQKFPTPAPPEQLQPATPVEGGAEAAGQRSTTQPDLSGIQRSYLETVQKANTSTPELVEASKNLQQTYQQKSNVDLMNKAQQAVEKDYSGSLSKVLSTDKLSDEDVAVGQEIMRKAQNEGRIDEAVNVADALDTKLRESGRAVQAASLWARLSPEGVLRLASKKAREARESNPDNIAKENKTAQELQGTLEKSNNINPEDISKTIQKIANGQQALPLEGVDTRPGEVENTGKALAKNVEKAAAPPKPKQVDTLVQELTKKVKQEYLEPKPSTKKEPLAILQEVFGRHPEAKEAYPYAQQILRDKYRDVPQMQDALDKFFGSKLGLPAASTTINNAIRNQLKQNGDRVSQTIYKSWKEQGQTVENTANALVKEGFDKDSANLLAKEVTNRLNKQISDAKLKTLQNMSKDLPEKQQSTFIEKINKLSNLGALDSQDYIQLARAKLNTPHLDPLTASKLSEMSQKLQALPQGDERNFLTNQIYHEISKLTPSTAGEKVFGLWRAGLLTGTHILPKVGLSHMVNALGETSSDAVAAGIDRFISKFGFSTGERAKTFTLKGIGEGEKRAVTKVGNLFKTGVDTGIGQNSITDFGRSIQYGNSVPGKILSAYVNGVGRAHGAVYKFFSEPKYINSLYDQGLAQAKNQGLKGKEADDFVADFVHTPSQQAMDLAEKDAREFAFQQETKLGNIATTIQQKGGVIGKVLAPFPRIPSAIATDVFNYTPAGGMKTIIDGIKAAKKETGWDIADQRAFTKGLGRSIVGTAAIIPGIMLYNRGMMTLGYPSDQKEQQLWQDEGKVPNSILVGGKWRSLGSMGPVGSVLSIGGHMADSLLQGKDFGTAVMNGMAGGLQSIQEQSYLQGTNQAITALNDPNKASGFVKGLAGSVVPSGIANLAQVTDKMQRDTTGNTIPQTAWDAIKNRIPGLRETLNAQTDAFGNKLRNNKGGLLNALDPGYGSTSFKSGYLLDELRRLQNAGYGEMPSYVNKKENFGSMRQPLYVNLTHDQQKQLEAIIGQITQYYWAQIVKSPSYQQEDDATRQSTLQQYHSSASTLGKLMFEQKYKLGQYAPNVQELLQKSKQKRLNVI